ncbi:MULTISPECIES: thioredoxin domain-containing protein [unclassified Nocardioides]|uniref:DsbA family protein n=1 Tax=unclassified Nocardioides TaxID=2615069 RepID=UPI00240765BC|nr:MULTISPECIES: thioredoxin domain-containing protein [unclassified Nocardioides]
MIGAVVALIVAAVAIVSLTGGGETPTETVDDTVSESPLVRADSRILGEEGSSGVTFVEFLDFECESCGAAYPVVEQLREEYAGRVTFVARYFPLPGHFNSERAARAVESAARQGEFEAMYQTMFETQASWGEGSAPLDDLFRSYAVDLGLDMAQYDADYASAEVADRVQADVEDGHSLNVSGTPTFYIDGRLVQPETVQDLADALDRALGE